MQYTTYMYSLFSVTKDLMKQKLNIKAFHDQSKNVRPVKLHKVTYFPREMFIKFMSSIVNECGNPVLCYIKPIVMFFGNLSYFLLFIIIFFYPIKFLTYVLFNNEWMNEWMYTFVAKQLSKMYLPCSSRRFIALSTTIRYTRLRMRESRPEKNPILLQPFNHLKS